MPEPGSGGAPLPKLPRSGPSRLVIGYAALGVCVIGVYLSAGVFGWAFAEEERDEVPASVRHSPGGYRAYHLWHSGYQGGK
jgi:hypothetical protein